MCVGGSELSTLEGTSPLVWVTCQWVNVSASQFRWYISEVLLHVPLSLFSGMEPSCLSISAHGHTHCLFSLPCLTSQTPCTQVLFPWFSLKGTSQNFGLPSHRENSAKITKFMIVNGFIIISSVRSEIIFLLLKWKNQLSQIFCTSSQFWGN